MVVKLELLNHYMLVEIEYMYLICYLQVALYNILLYEVFYPEIDLISIFCYVF